MQQVFSDLAAGEGKRASLESTWGAARSLNAGDGFFALAQAALFKATVRDSALGLQAMAILDRAARGLSEEIRTMTQRTDATASGSLLAAGAALGALFGRGDAETVAKLEGFGRSLSQEGPPRLNGDKVAPAAQQRLTEAAQYIAKVASR
jgi:hypothetical protein